MSTAAGSAGYSVGQSYHNDHVMIHFDVRTLTGEEFRLRVDISTLGSEVRKMVLDNLPVRSGAKLVLDHMRHRTSEQVEETVRLKLHQTLQEQGFAEAETAILCCTYVPTQLQAAWCVLMGFETFESELALEGVTHLTTESPLLSNLTPSWINSRQLELVLTNTLDHTQTNTHTHTNYLKWFLDLLRIKIAHRCEFRYNSQTTQTKFTRRSYFLNPSIHSFKQYFFTPSKYVSIESAWHYHIHSSCFCSGALFRPCRASTLLLLPCLTSGAAVGRPL